MENIGTSELILVGIVALIFLGPRKLPEMAHKIGKLMAEFRSASYEFKSTWEREVNFEEDERALRDGLPEAAGVARDNSIIGGAGTRIDVPEIRSIDRDAFEKLAPAAIQASRDEAAPAETPDSSDGSIPEALSDKRTWL